MRPLVAHCDLGVGILHRRMGNRARAEEHLTLARDAFTDVAVEFWAARARRELGAKV